MAHIRGTHNIPVQRGEHLISSHVAHIENNAAHAAASLHPTLRHREPAPQPPPPSQPLKIELLPAMTTVREKLRARMRARVSDAQTPSRLTKIKNAIQNHAKKFPHAKALGSFVLVALLVVSPLHAITTFEKINSARGALTSLGSISAAPFATASETVTETLRVFHSAQNSLSRVTGIEEFLLIHTPIIGERFGVVQRLTAAGERVSFAAASYMQLFKTLQQGADAPVIERLSLFFEGNRAVVRDLEIAADLVRPINPDSFTDETQRTRIRQARAAILALYNDAGYLISAGPVILSTLGSLTPRRYLVVFQNPAELRPTGGFIGSFALLDIKNGAVQKLFVPPGGSYDLQGVLKTNVHAPLPLHIINARWEFQDGNWFPDFPTSARKLMWFLEKSQGPTVDGVIAINASVLPALLAVVGPVTLENGQTVTADDALQYLRQSINTSVAQGSNKPKQIVTDLAPALVKTVTEGSREKFLGLITTLLQSLERRDIQFYARDESLQRQITSFGWDGAVRDNPDGDYLFVVNTNIGGQKTDAVVKQSIDHQAQIAEDGTVRVTVRLVRTQSYSDRAFEGGPNVTYTRLYVPRGSILENAVGFTSPAETSFQAAPAWQKEDEDLRAIEKTIGTDPATGTRMTEEFGHTVFGNWMITKPGGTTEAVITYRIPLVVRPDNPTWMQGLVAPIVPLTPVANYRFFAQHQSGAINDTLSSRVIIPESWRPAWVTNPLARIANNGILIETPFTQDEQYGTTFYLTQNP